MEPLFSDAADEFSVPDQVVPAETLTIELAATLVQQEIIQALFREIAQLDLSGTGTATDLVDQFDAFRSRAVFLIQCLRL